MKPKKNDIITQNRIFAWVAAATGLILLIPLIAMQFSADVVWTLSDFIAMAVLLFGAGSVFVILARLIPSRRRLLAAIVVLILLWLYVELAVGLFTNWGS